MSIVVISSGGPNLGFGHIRRSLVLIEYLRTKGYAPRHLILNDIETIITQCKLELKLDLDLIIIDSPLDCSELILLARKSNIKTLTLDGNCGIEADFDISLDPRNKTCDNVFRYTGFQYALISENILRYRTHLDLINSSKINRVTIAIGGGDVLKKGIQTATYLSAKGFKVSIIKGPFANYENPQDRQFEIIKEPRDIGRIIFESDWMVTNGGNTLFEAMSLGKPCFVLPQTEKERNLAQFFLENKLILGYADSIEAKYLDLPNRVCSENAFSYIDGYGASRILEILERIIEKG